MHDSTFIPKEIVSNVPRLTLVGNESLQVEQHRGLLLCQPEEMRFRSTAGEIRITGRALGLQLYTAADAVIAGEISRIDLIPSGGAL